MRCHRNKEIEPMSAIQKSAQIEGQIQISADGKTIWVHSIDGSTIGRFSTVFGMDVHRTAEEQQQGAPQCLHCTHTKPTQSDWEKFCELMLEHYGVEVDVGLMTLS